MSFTAITEENYIKGHLSSAAQAWQGGAPCFRRNEYRPASVTDMLKSWKAKMLITGNTRIHPYGAGRKTAVQVVRKHRL